MQMKDSNGNNPERSLRLQANTVIWSLISKIEFKIKFRMSFALWNWTSKRQCRSLQKDTKEPVESFQWIYLPEQNHRLREHTFYSDGEHSSLPRPLYPGMTLSKVHRHFTVYLRCLCFWRVSHLLATLFKVHRKLKQSTWNNFISQKKNMKLC